ncbi:ABC transporter permease [Paenibacillus protaetiae]|uniref:ABC transporter permease n=1 Tax=Paenibacillus protaetiae TaxID=2509456 RepID=A0A4P6F6R0_9BACL|nr:ABC transporter permease [Paenibacillus protaetiae]QAY66098.1 ABC transporter permease [Paenibacillus protaetiae]
MLAMIGLIQNETLKIWRKKRFFVILLLLLALIPIFTYAEQRVLHHNQAHFTNWRSQVLQQITDLENTLSSDRMPEEWKKHRKVVVQQLQYYLEHDVNPSDISSVTFTREFLQNAMTLLIPVLVLALASDIVSGERAEGTIKLLLARPVRRWRILFSKLAALTLYVSLIVVLTAVISYLVSGLAFGYGGWTMPVFTGFMVKGSAIDSTYAHIVPQWQYLLMQMGLTWIAAMTVAWLSLMVSVLLRSTSASIVTMTSVLIAGTLLSNMASSWHASKYLFSVNLNLAHYLNGSPPPVEGMTFLFSLAVLGIWAAASVVVSFTVFTKQDILN